MNQKLLVILLSLAAVAVVSIALYQKYFRPSPTSAPDESQKTIAVSAQNGKFTPDTFSTDVLDTLILNVNAVDQDYNFQVPDYPRLDTQIPKGQTTTVKIQYLGEGEYTFTCGPNCAGQLSVVQQSDTEDEE